MSTHRSFRTWMDAFGIAILVLFVAVSIGSLFLNLKYWGISGLFLGRLFNRNDGGGIHTLAVLGVIVPSFLWGRKTGTNNMIVAISAFFTDYYHEGLWNLPYYVYYHMRLDQVPYYALIAVFCFLWFGTIIYAKKGHDFRHGLFLLPWFVLITFYLLGVHAYSEDLFGPQSYYANIPVNLYEILEVNLFAWSLYFAITRPKEKALIPVLATVFKVSLKPERPVPVPVPVAKADKGGVTDFVSYALGIPIFWIIIIATGLVWLLGI